MTRTTNGFAFAAALLIAWCGVAGAEIYKVVGADGSVTYTDQAPSPSAEPMDLPDLSVVETEAPESLADATATEGDAAAEGPTPRELRRMYRDFRITRPAPEETFWGTANTVVVSWGSTSPLQPGMTVRLFVDGQAQPETQESMVALTLDRGTHTVHAELRDSRGRRITTTEQVTFFVKQQSRLFNQPAANPGP